MPHVKVEKFRLGNGLTVVVCPNHTSPIVSVDVMYKVGSHDEVFGKSGLAHLFEHLMFDNTSTGMAKQYDTYCTKAGGVNNAYTTHDFTNYYITLPAHQLETGLWLESERMRSFNIGQEHLTTQISVVLEEINQNVDNQPYGKWRTAIANNSFTPDCSYSWDVYGSVQDVAGVKMEDARCFFERFYAPSNAVLCIAGDVSVERGFALADKYFGDVVNVGAEISRNTFSNAMREYGKHVVIPDQVPMSAVFVGIHASSILHKNNPVEELACVALGSGKNSPLYTHIVKNKRVASGAGVFLDRREQSSQVDVYAYAADDSVSADTLFAEMQTAIGEYTYTQSEHAKAINKMKAGYAAELQKASGVSDAVAFYETFYKDGELVNRALDRYSECKLQDVQACIESYADLSKAIRIDVVPEQG